MAITGLPGDDIQNPEDLSPTNYGEEIQYAQHNTANGGYGGMKSYVSPSARRNNIDNPVNGMSPEVIQGKRFFGLFGLLKKPADFGDDPNSGLHFLPGNPWKVLSLREVDSQDRKTPIGH